MDYRKVFLLSFILGCAFQGLLIARQGEIDSLKSALQQVEESEKIWIYRDLARLYSRIDLDSSRHFLELMRAGITDENRLKAEAHDFKIRGLQANQLMQYQQAISDFQQAYDLFREAGNYDEMGWTARGLGRAYFLLGSYDNATESFLKALSAFQEDDDRHGIAGIYNNLGAACYVAGHNEKAIKYYESAIQLFNEIGKPSNNYQIYNNLGIIHFGDEQYEAALDYYFRAIELMQKTENPGSLAGIYSNIALCYLKLDQLNTANMYIRRAVKISEENQDKFTLISARLNLGVILSARGLADSAMVLFNEVMYESDSLGLKQIQEEAYNELALHYERNGMYQLAFEAHKEYFDLHDELHNQRSQQRMENLIAGYEQKIKQQDLAQLKADRETQSMVNKILALLIGISLASVLLLIYGYSNKRKSNRLLEEKNVQLSDVNQRLLQSEFSLKTMIEDNNKLFSIVAHDLRNPIAAVSGFSELLYDNYDQLDDDTRKEYLNQIIQGSVRTHDLLDNLLLWARSQMDAVSIKKKAVKVEDLIESSILSVQIAMNHKKITLDKSIDENFSIEADPEMIKAVIRNLLTNAVKFSFPNGRVRLLCFRSGQMGCIEVHDNGIGMQPEIQENLFRSEYKSSTPGTSGETGSGLGLLICKDYTERNGGNIAVESNPGQGSKFIICLPIAGEEKQSAPNTGKPAPAT